MASATTSSASLIRSSIASPSYSGQGFTRASTRAPAASISFGSKARTGATLAPSLPNLVNDRGVQAVSKDRRGIEVVSFEERLALLLLTTADGNRALIDEAIQAVADEGLSTLEDVLDYIEQNRTRPLRGSAVH
jgi:hypothetical protein